MFTLRLFLTRSKLLFWALKWRFWLLHMGKPKGFDALGKRATCYWKWIMYWSLVENAISGSRLNCVKTCIVSLYESWSPHPAIWQHEKEHYLFVDWSWHGPIVIRPPLLASDRKHITTSLSSSHFYFLSKLWVGERQEGFNSQSLDISIPQTRASIIGLGT